MLFEVLKFTQVGENVLFPDIFPKLPNQLVEGAFEKINEQGKYPVRHLLRRASNSLIFYQESTGYWVKAAIGIPYYAKDGVEGTPSHGRFLYFDDADTCATVFALLNSSLFYAYFIGFGDCFHLSNTLVSSFPLAPGLERDQQLASLGNQLMMELKENAETITIQTRDGSEISYAEFFGWKSKRTIDSIDSRLSDLYGFTEAERDAVIYFDAKYRLSQEADSA